MTKAQYKAFTLLVVMILDVIKCLTKPNFYNKYAKSVESEVGNIYDLAFGNEETNDKEEINEKEETNEL